MHKTPYHIASSSLTFEVSSSYLMQKKVEGTFVNLFNRRKDIINNAKTYEMSSMLHYSSSSHIILLHPYHHFMSVFKLFFWRSDNFEDGGFNFLTYVALFLILKKWPT
jgi:hypothetical protein